jgi:hypothetical protein
MSDANSNTPNVALVLNRDLLFGSRMRSAMAGLGLEARFVGSTDQFVAALREHDDSLAIGIIDMNGVVIWDRIADALREEGDVPPTLAFGSHMDVENLRAAKDSGVTRVVSNGQFHREMPELIERYRRR